MSNLIVYIIREGEERDYWNRCGVAFRNKDGSLNMKLDLFPDVRFQIREPKQREKGERGGEQ
ncbi:hypothetical protein MYX82_02715 [Acidobacteria bacterium AH-259-D05]|nr:hypothetical protein [Acidobacteria bacterium AH-259-D05]